MQTITPVFEILKWRPKGIPYLKRLPSGLWSIEGRVCCCVYDEDKILQDVLESFNTVTNVGDRFYSYRGAAEQPTDAHFTSGATIAFDGIMELYNGASGAPAKTNDRSDLVGLVSGSAKAIDATYPKSNDSDADNTGKDADADTYKVTYTTGEANASSIDDVIITNPSPGSSENLLMHADSLGSFTKTSSDTLVVYVNHQMTG